MAGVRPGRALVLAMLVVTAGCVTALPTLTPEGPTATEFEATVVEVVDGDTVEVRFDDGDTENVRLLGIDTPEVHVETDPAEWEGIPETGAGRSHLREWGHAASDFVRSRLDAGETVRLVVDETADRRGSYGRLLVYLYDGGDLLNRLLLERGYARLYESDFTKRATFAAIESRAREDGVGVWSYGDDTAGLAGHESRTAPGADRGGPYSAADPGMRNSVVGMRRAPPSTRTTEPVM